MLLRSYFRRAIFAFAIRHARFSFCAKLKFPQADINVASGILFA